MARDISFTCNGNQKYATQRPSYSTLIANERKIGLIPRLWVQGKWGPQEWAIFVTDQRTILVLEKSSKAGIGAAFGAIGTAVAAAATSQSRGFDYSQMDANALALDPKNTVIPHEALRGIRMKKKMIGSAYELELQYVNSEGKNKDFKGALLPPEVVIKNRKGQGEEKGQIFLDYARNAVNLFQNALSPPRFQSLASIPPL